MLSTGTQGAAGTLSKHRKTNPKELSLLISFQFVLCWTYMKWCPTKVSGSLRKEGRAISLTSKENQYPQFTNQNLIIFFANLWCENDSELLAIYLNSKVRWTPPLESKVCQWQPAPGYRCCEKPVPECHSSADVVACGPGPRSHAEQLWANPNQLTHCIHLSFNLVCSESLASSSTAHHQSFDDRNINK